MKVRVAFVTNFVPPYRVTFFSKMAALPGIELLVVQGEVKKETGRPAAAISGKWNFNYKTVVNNEKTLGPFVIRWQSGLFPVLRAFNPDVVVVLGISGTITSWTVLIWARLKKLRSLMWMCGWEAQERNSFAYRLKRVWLKIFIKLPTTLLVYSSKARDYMVELGVPAERCVICYNGIDIEESLQRESEIKDQAKRLRKKLNTENHPVFLYVGGILPEKRVDLLLQAFAKLRKNRSALLWIVGDGPAMNEMKELAAALRIPDISFLGRIIDDVDPYFSAADFFVLPGIGGLALNQAMFWGTPCICAEGDGTEEDLVIDGVSGFRFQPGDEVSLVAALNRGIDVHLEGTLYSSMAAKGRELIETRSNTDRMLKTYYAEFVKGRLSPHK